MGRKIVFFFILIIGIYSASYAASKSVHVLRIQDEIVGPVIQEYISDGIRKATDAKAECLVIELDTPGGLLKTTRTIVRDIMSAAIPVVVYVSPQGARAGSAGVFITLASHIAAMAPSTNIGAAHPVVMGEKGRSIKNWTKEIEKLVKEKSEMPQEEIPNDTMSQKILNDTLAWVRAIAEERGRNVEWAENSVRKSFSQTEKEALNLNVIDFVAKDLRDLLQKIDGQEVQLSSGIKKLETKNAHIETQELTLRQKILLLISNPNVSFILMLLGFYGLLFEFTHPGFGFPGIGGVVCLVLAFYSFQTLPVNYAGVALIVLGITLLISEAFVSGFGLFALGGMVSLLIGSFLFMDSSYHFYQISLYVILPLVLVTGVITLLLVTLAVKAQRSKVETGIEAMVGLTAIVASEIKGEGYVYVHGELWKAVSEEGFAKGDKVKVTRVDGLVMHVEKL